MFGFATADRIAGAARVVVRKVRRERLEFSICMKHITTTVEMRTYKIEPGCGVRFLEILRSKSIPAHDEIEMKILGPFLSAEDPIPSSSCEDSPTWLRGEPMKAQFHEGELGKCELENLLMPMIEKPGRER
jgi:hypothetical protein